MVFSFLTMRVAIRVSTVNKDWNNAICKQPSLHAKYAYFDKKRFTNLTRSPLRHHVSCLIPQARFSPWFSSKHIMLLSKAMPRLSSLKVWLNSQPTTQTLHFPLHLSVLDCRFRDVSSPSLCTMANTVKHVKNTLATISTIYTLLKLTLHFPGNSDQVLMHDVVLPTVLSSLRTLQHLTTLDFDIPGYVVGTTDVQIILSLPVLTILRTGCLFSQSCIDQIADDKAFRQRAECVDLWRIPLNPDILATLSTFPSITKLCPSYPTDNLVNMSPLADMAQLRTLNLISGPIMFNLDSLVVVMPFLTQLEDFHIEHSQLTTDYLLRLLTPLKTLKILNYRSTTRSIISSFLSDISSLADTLEELTLDLTLQPFCDVQHVKKLTSLRKLYIYHLSEAELNRDAIDALHDALPCLEYISQLNDSDEY